MQRLRRLVRVFWILGRHRLDRLVPQDAVLPRPVRLLLWLLSRFPNRAESPAISLRLAFEDLGPIYIKFGQALSTRKDLFEEAVSDQLQRLQDQVPPFDIEAAVTIIETALEAPIDELFAQFDRQPLASASVAQVHTAELKSGKEVVVKVIRPGIEKVIREDLQVMYMFAQLLERVWVHGERLHPVDIVRDYEHTILDELNLQLEAANGAQLRKNWQLTGKLYVPQVYWDYTRENVLVLERIYGVQVTNLETLRSANTNLKRLAHLGVEIFFTQVFEHNFFHADMHPGNVYVDISDPDNPTYIALDCAIIGSLTDEDKNYLARNLLAFFNRDYYEVAKLHVESGWVPPDTNVKDFESVIRSVCEPLFQKPISEISFGRVVVSLFQTAQRFNMEVQPQLVLLQKTLLNIEGLGRQIYPQLDLWETAAPFMERWMSERLGIKGVLRQFRHDMPFWLNQLPELPHLAIEALHEMRGLGRHMESQTQLLTRMESELKIQTRKNRAARWGGLALLAALLGVMAPAYGMQSEGFLLGSSVLGGLGIYLTFLKP